MLVHDLLTAAEAQHGNDVAVIDSEETLTYTTLWHRVSGCADWLTAAGVRPGDRVVYAGESDRRLLSFFYATTTIGAIFVPVHPDLTTHQLRHIVADSGAELVLRDPSTSSADSDGVAGHGAPFPEPLGAHVVPIDTAWEGGISAAGPALPWLAADTDPSNPALLIYTSGTTGRPKGVVCPHRQVLVATDAINDRLGYRSDDVVLCRLPLAFDYGLYQALLSVRTGAALLLAQRSQDLKLTGLIDQHQVTVIPLVPSLAQMLAVLKRHSDPLPSVRLLTNTGARMSADSIERLTGLLPNAAYASMYGMTECKRISILDPAEFADHPDSVGYPIRGDEVLIIGSDGDRAAPYETGEIVVRGDTVMAGYWGVPLADQDRFVARADGSLELHTGDQGYVDDDGRLYFVGRNDDIVKRRGVRISLTEVEAAAERIDGVSAAVALTSDSDDLTLAVISSRDTGTVRAELAISLDHARMPSRIVALDLLPLTANGKPDRTAVRGLLTPSTSARRLAA